MHTATRMTVIAPAVCAAALSVLPAGAQDTPVSKDVVALAAVANPPRKLDLRAPDVTTIFTQAEIERVLRATRDPDTIEEVEVERDREKAGPTATPDIPPGILAPFWALMNPAQAWRIFLPLPPDQAQKASAPPDATDSYREPTLPPQ